MKSFVFTENASYGEKLAGFHDRMYPDVSETELAVDFVSALAPAGGRILGVGGGHRPRRAPAG